ncbi:hypothetical protein CXU09_10415 [Akkermansia muciniphila]|uniref:Uncharacterized protein n=1 Tax=Akkermansia muciniphila TaxID=239935 RepID=A0AAP8NJY2_9BACT|nr:hypothetical protein CXU09_10415 [Akkermansia muciniphila]
MKGRLAGNFPANRFLIAFSIERAWQKPFARRFTKLFHSSFLPGRLSPVYPLQFIAGTNHSLPPQFQ